MALRCVIGRGTLMVPLRISSNQSNRHSFSASPHSSVKVGPGDLMLMVIPSMD